MIRSRSKPSLEFSLASMSDIIFQLLIFFMLTLSINATSGVKVDLPKSGKPSKQDASFSVSINKDGELYFEDERVDAETMKDKLRTVLTDENEEDDVILLRTDREVKMEQSAVVISAVAEFGGKIVIAIDKETVKE